MYVRYFFIFIVFFIVFSLYDCARVGRPTGGEKDILPPVTISASPDFESINYSGEKIKISFNEYIKFKDLNRQLVISPPLKYKPEISPLGFPSKYITIKIKDTLKENTTYTFNFGNAIIDNSEGNPLKQFKYLFSTGSTIDSLKVSGTVKDAFLQKPDADISVLIYAADSTYHDSIVYKSKPNYVTSTLDSTGFSITNIKNGDYYLYALSDRNRNLVFDPKEDKIAFIAGPVSVLKDTIYELCLFKEQPEFAIKNISELSKNHLVVGYEGFINATVEDLIDKNKNTVPFLSYQDSEKDSLHIWYNSIDSDTLLIRIKQKDSISTTKKRLRSKELDSLRLYLNINKILPWSDSLSIVSNIPITTIDKNQIKLFDTDSTAIPFNILKEEINTSIIVDFVKKENKNYILHVLPAAITNFLGQKNDSLVFNFRTKKLADYGNLAIGVKTANNTPLIIELLNNKGSLITRRFVTQDKEIKFSFLQPGKYKLRAIYDNNDNKRWDTGDFLKKIQAERVLYHSKIIEIRANWSISEVFTIK